MDEIRVTSNILTVPRRLVKEPFSKINYWELSNGGKRMKISLLVEAEKESKKDVHTGVAIDGSYSMKEPFGKTFSGMPTKEQIDQYRAKGMVRYFEKDDKKYYQWSKQAITELVEKGTFKHNKNIVSQQIQEIVSYLATFDVDGKALVIYWATGVGKEIEVVGEFTKEAGLQHVFEGPINFGEGTFLLPAIKYFTERFKKSEWGIYLFITDGYIQDMEAVKAYCVELASEITRGERNDLKFVIIGVGSEVEVSQLVELDDLDTGTDIDLWDHKIASEMQQLAEIFAEVIDANEIVVENDGIIRDSFGNVIRDYRDSGLPALIEFDLTPGSNVFSLEIAGHKIEQNLTEEPQKQDKNNLSLKSKR